jgi:hypothetical protein
MGVKVLVAGLMVVRSFVFVMVRRCSTGWRGGYSWSGRSSFPNIILLGAHIIHTGVEFGNVTVTLNKVVGVFQGQSQHRSSIDEGGNNSKSGACRRHV